MDIGNTNIKTGLFKDGRLQNSWRLRTDSLRTADEYGTQMEGFFGHLNIDTREVDGIIMSSFIPSMNYTMEHMCELYFHQQKVMVVNSEMNPSPPPGGMHGNALPVHRTEAEKPGAFHSCVQSGGAGGGI